MGTFNDWPFSENGLYRGKQKSDVAVLGACYDLGATTNGGGMRMAPTAIRLSRVEALEVRGVDVGDVRPEDGLEGITAAVRHVRGRTKRLIVLGGDDSINFAVLWGLRSTGTLPFMLHLDAHADDELGELDHSSWVGHVVQQKLVSESMSIGVRTMKDQRQYGNWNYFDVIDAIPEDKPIYVAVDIDVADPAFAPGTSFPEPGGMTAAELLRIVDGVCSKRQVVALSITEVLPHKDLHGITALLANRIAQVAAQSAR